MLKVPLIGRLSFREYIALVFGFTFVAFEAFIHVLINFIPSPIIRWFYNQSRSLFDSFTKRHPRLEKRKPESQEKKAAEKILNSPDFIDLCKIHDYTPEEHVVLTKDGYLLVLHRLPSKRGEQSSRPGTSTGKPVVYLHHGLLMNSEIWVCLTEAERALPFVLAEQGYDVWLGNNRYVHRLSFL
jgi:lysosomal acid lipase/cholesteryl ester hydrolase